MASKVQENKMNFKGKSVRLHLMILRRYSPLIQDRILIGA